MLDWTAGLDVAVDLEYLLEVDCQGRFVLGSHSLQHRRGKYLVHLEVQHDFFV